MSYSSDSRDSSDTSGLQKHAETSETTNGAAPESDTASVPDDGDDAPHVIALRPAASVFSMRRLLNRASLVVACILLLALAIHWLPGALSAMLSSRQGATPPPAGGHLGNAPGITNSIVSPPARGKGWKPIGPNWGQSVAFSTDAQVGYVCGSLGRGNAPILVARFDPAAVASNPWTQFASPTTGNICQVSVSPVNADDVALVVSHCVTADCSYSAAQVYRSQNGGASWSALHLPAAQSITSIAWTNQATLFLVAMSYALGSVAPLTFSLLASRADGPLTTISPQTIVGHAEQFGPIGLVSSGAVVYATLDGGECLNYCTVLARTSDEGYTWTQLPATYRSAPLVPEVAQPNTSTLIGWIFEAKAGALTVARSDDNGSSWRALPPLPANPATGGTALFITPDGAIYAFCFGSAGTVYRLASGAGSWQSLGPLPTGAPLAVEYDAAGHGIALWGQAINPTAALGLEYYPLPA